MDGLSDVFHTQSPESIIGLSGLRGTRFQSNLLPVPP